MNERKIDERKREKNYRINKREQIYPLYIESKNKTEREKICKK